MTWARQVRHVFVRNIADTWESLAVAVGCIALVAAQAALGWVDEFWIGVLVDYAVRLSILFHLAHVVQRDPPPQPGSFWATQPRRSTAVATAKLLQVILIVTIVTASSLIVHSTWGFSGAAQLAALNAQLAYVVILSLAVIMTVALTPAGQRATIGATLLCLSYSTLADQESRSQMLPGSIREVIDTLPSWIWLLLMAMIVGVFVWRYGRAQLPRHADWPVMALAILPFSLLIRGDPIPRSAVAAVSSAPPLALVLEARSDYLVFDLVAQHGLPGDAYRLVNWSMFATRRDGSAVTLDGFDDILRRDDGRSAVVRPRGDSLHIIGGKFLDMHDSTSFHNLAGSYGVFANDNLGDVVSARLHGTIESYRVAEIDRFPLRSGDAMLHDGHRATLTMLTADTAGPGILLDTKWLSGTTQTRAAWPLTPGWRARELSFALVNRARGSVLPLRITQSDQSGIGALKIGFGVNEIAYTLRPAIWTPERPSVDSAWLADAEMIVGTPVLVGAVRIEVAGGVTGARTR
jgi:hypothetical protein